MEENKWISRCCKSSVKVNGLISFTCDKCNKCCAVDKPKEEELFILSKGDEINSIMSVIMRRLSEKQLIILRDKLIARTPIFNPQRNKP